MSHELIIKTTSDLINCEKIDIDSIDQLLVDPSGFFGRICSIVFGSYSRNESFKLKMAFKRNSWQYKEKVNALLINNLKGQRSESFHFSYLEWQKFIELHIGKKDNFLTDFHDKLAKKLQEKGKSIYLYSSYLTT
jgi:hypothetical protein